jgi:S1-C subfamily serine protease
VGSLAFESLGSSLVVRDLPPEGTPAWDAGLAQDDVILRVDEMLIDSRAAWERVLARLRPGQVVAVEIERRGVRSRLSLRVGEDPEVTVVRLEGAGGRLTPAQDAFRKGWLDSKVGVLTTP